MSILSRFTDIVSANINALLDRAEDPAKMVDQYLRNAMEDFAEVKKETAAVMAEANRCKRLVDEATAEADKYDGLARKALTAGNEDDARVFITKKQEISGRLADLLPAYETANANAEKMRQMHDKLRDDIENLRARKNSIKATMAVAQTQERVNKAAAAMSGTHGSIAAFERMEEKANAMLDRASAAAELEAGAGDEAAELAKKYESGSVSVDEELARMKQELGQ